MTSVQIHKINTVLITGASSGIGLQLAQDYLAAGWHVIACGRDKAKLDALADTVLVGATCFNFDITERSQVQQVATQVGDLLSSSACQLDLVILNAGGCEYIDDAKHFDDRLFERVVHTNLIAMGYCLGAFLPLMAKGSHLALMSSSATYLAFPRAEAYGASKAGVQYLAASLRLDLAQHGISVSVICPGFVATPLTAKNDFAMPMQVDTQSASTAIRRGLLHRETEIHFPKRFTYLLKLMSFLPAFVWQKMIQRDSQPRALKDAGR
ncbi:SDR family NAD(P)-dependent oxidoreductase [Shewanella decolorationis]|uniref:SDR family NAD(P)-dependent oxidoreductase n=1 Tax=Shewanella decolorationis TaxID=256839 RepID=A0A5B8QUW6_9GAMM|nr:SDR family NAD(P)-dependent oxidoreductase [Shewanella decolorationis]QDZ90234.1 SDR family NAD(P)-dependent oxidoreductase [Shewanella decolorationis]